ncbi:signal peptide peptidase SppA [Novispirillum sp. DQ9]|uniref:signal peptide peptidase SppA n=1 Tax=Novispirillum sp. DQ9 TaxID=3398612 RepID=UPI003C7E7ACF
MRAVGKILVSLLAIVGVLTLAVVGLAWWGLSHVDVGGSLHKPLPQRIVLHLPFDRAFPEAEASLTLGGLRGGTALSVRQVIAALDHAAADPRVVAVVASIGESGRGMAQAQELRSAVERFRASGKPAIAFADTLGEGGNGTVDYYLASAFSEVWMQPSGLLALTGFGIEVPFAQDALTSLGVATEYGQRHEFKNAMDSLVRQSMSEEHRESLRALLASFEDQVAHGVAASRELSVRAVRDILDGPPLFADEAKQAGLLTGTGYWDQILAQVNALNDGAAPVPLHRYAEGVPPAAPDSAPTVALIRVTGTIVRGVTDTSPFGTADSSGGDSVAKALRQAIDDPKVRGIVLRIDSPGGSYVASDTIWREVMRARERKLPIIASMGDVAASGGYFAAMGADAIVAQPGTITGSIGVFALKPVLADMWGKVNIHWDRVNDGDFALMWSPNRPFTAAEQAWFDRMLDTIYRDFTTKAAQSRRLDAAQVDRVARGRIFTGMEAQAAGLVDALGGLDVAVLHAKRAAGLGDADAVRLTPYPEPKTGLEAIQEMLSGEEAPMAIATLLRLGGLLAPVAAEIDRAAVSARGPALMTPPGVGR